MASNIDIIINAQDKTKDAFNKASAGMSGFKDKVEGMKPTFQKMALAGTAAFTAFAGVAITSLKAYSEAQAQTEITNQSLQNSFNQLSGDALKNLQDQVGKSTSALSGLMNQAIKAGDAAVKMGFDDETAANSFSRLFSVTKDVTKSHNELQLAMDLARYKGISLEEATQKLIMVHSGSTKELKLMGLAVTDGATAMQNLDSIQKQVTGSAATFAQTTQGATEILKVQFDNLKETIGGALEPAFSKLITAVTPLLEKFAAWAEANPELLSKILLIGGAVAALVAVVGMLGLVLPAIITGFALLFSPIGMLIIVIGIIILKWKEFAKMWTDLWEGIKTAAKAGADAIMSVLQPVFDFVMKIVNAIDKAVSFVGDKVGGGKKKKVNDAVINPSGDIVETNPNDWIIATQNPGALFGNTGGGGITVNINGGNFLDENVADEIGDMILSKLQFQMRGA